MLKKANRFHGYGSLRHVYRSGTTVRGPVTALKYLKNQHRQTYRLAVVVSRKVSKSAVVRNRIRRRIFEIVRGFESDLNGPYDLVITVFSESVADMPADQLSKQIKNQFAQANLLA